MFESRRLGERRNKLGQHAIAGRELDEGLGAFRQALMVATEPTPPGDPGKAALSDPATLPPDAVFWFWVFAMVFSFPDLLV